MRNSTRALLALLFLALGLAGGCHLRPPAGDILLIRGARIYTLAWDEPAPDGTPAPNAPRDAKGWHPDASALVIEGGTIVFVGDDVSASRRAGRNARVLDAGGATVLPGLIESHTHVAEMGRNLRQVRLVDLKTEEQAVAKVAAHARGIPKGNWVRGYGWDEGAWANRYPTMEALSEAVPDHPVLLRSLHGFAVWGNRKAFAAAGITAATKQPSGGEILRDANGQPTGVLLNRATQLLEKALPPRSRADIEGNLLAALTALAAAGYTAVHEAGVPAPTLAALEHLEKQGRLPLRFHAMLSARDPVLCREWQRRGPQAATGMLGVCAVKAYYDAALGSHGALLLADYSDRPGHRGVAGGEYQFDAEVVGDMMQAGFQVAIHAIGDAGNRDTLDFIEAQLARQPALRANRHRIEHAQVVHPADFERFAELGLTASMQPPHAVEDKTWAETRLGTERVKGAYAWRRMREAGVRLILNSDLPGSDHSIFYGLHAAITRQDKDRQPEGGWHPEQRLTPEEAVRGYTSWAAWAGFMDAGTGTIEPGKFADLTIMDIDPFVLGETEPARLLDGKILMTIVDGRVIWSAPDRRPTRSSQPPSPLPCPLPVAVF